MGVSFGRISTKEPFFGSGVGQIVVVEVEGEGLVLSVFVLAVFLCTPLYSSSSAWNSASPEVMVVLDGVVLVVVDVVLVVEVDVLVLVVGVVLVVEVVVEVLVLVDGVVEVLVVDVEVVGQGTYTE